MGTKNLINRESIASDLVAGLTSALVYIPKGMAYALVAGINPVHGLYTGMVAPFAGALFAGSSFMAIVATNELAVPTGNILAGLGGGSAIQILFALTLLTGVFQLAFGLLRLGSMVRFISESVMTGFVTGVAVFLILGQLEKLTGYHGEISGTLLVKTWDWMVHLGQIDGATTFVGLTTIAVILGLQKTRFHKFALLLAMVFAGLLAAIMNRESVSLLGKVTEFSGGLPSPVLPDLKALPELVVPALSLAIVGLSVSAGLSQGYPEPDGSLPDTSRDFVGQGAANIAAGFFQGMPAGGSFSNTAISLGAGAKTRMANVFFGVILAASLFMISALVKRIPMAALAALLIVIGFEMIKPQRLLRVRSTHWSETLAMGLTFLLTLTIPLQYAILAGVLLTLGLYIYSSSQKLLIVEIVPLGDGRYEERPSPTEFPSNQTTILGVYGNAFFAAVYTLERSLPSVENTRNAAIIFSLRGREMVTSSLLAFLERYAKKARASGNRLMLAGVEPKVMKELEKSGTLRVIGEENVFAVTAILGDSLRAAYLAVQEWLKKQRTIR